MAPSEEVNGSTIILDADTEGKIIEELKIDVEEFNCDGEGKRNNDNCIFLVLFLPGSFSDWNARILMNLKVFECSLTNVLLTTVVRWIHLNLFSDIIIGRDNLKQSLNYPREKMNLSI